MVKDNQILMILFVADASNDDIATAFLNQMTAPTCLGEYLLFDNATAMANEISCTTTQTCNWAPCNSLTNANCTEAHCLDPAMGSDFFCGACLYDQCIEISFTIQLLLFYLIQIAPLSLTLCPRLRFPQMQVVPACHARSLHSVRRNLQPS